MRVAIRTDASRAIGTGHLKRCLSLAVALRAAGAEPHFVSRNLGIGSAAAVKTAGFSHLALAQPSQPDAVDDAVPHAPWAEVAWDSDAAETVAALDDPRPDWVVVDHYAFDARWHDAVRMALGCRIAVIDDLADRLLAADVLIDHNFAPDHRAKYSGRISAGTRVLAGPRFALLAPSYATAARHMPSDTVRSIGIFMGGIDAENISAIVLKAIDAAGFSGRVEVVTTSGNPNVPILQDVIAARPDTVLSLDLPDLAQFFARHDLQIGGGGGATWERSCVGAPTISLVVADNQQVVIPALAAMGALASTDVSNLTAHISALIADPVRRVSLARIAGQLVDGRGATRCALALAAPTVCLRPADKRDTQRAFDWRNDRATRAVSRSSEPLNFSSHTAWFDRILADPSRTLFVGMVGDVPIGFIRLDRRGDDTCEVSLYLDPGLHGLGLGKPLLLAVEAHVSRGHAILAEVLDGNETSARLFAAAGYRAIASGQWAKQVGESEL